MVDTNHKGLKLDKLQTQFEEKWLHKYVKCLGKHYEFAKDDIGYVTAALYRWNEEITIFAVNFEKSKWIKFHIGQEEFGTCMSDFEILPIGVSR